ncbi:MAG: flagellar biosynthetic protein FliR [Bdellovibrionales bacterium]|nr:flagellar biosynthetic protein FliR [Bdellovibrionales bacterium]
MVFTTWSADELLSFFMVLVRVSTLLILFPMFGDKAVPATVKIFLSVCFSAILFPILRSNGVIDVQAAHQWSSTTTQLLMTLFSEILMGLAIGFASQLVFQAVHVAGDFISQLMGLSMATSYDPHFESQAMMVSQLLGALAMLTFLSLDGHHVLFRAIVESFRLVPQGHFVGSEAFKDSIINLTGNTLKFGVQLAAPMAACMMLVNIVYGILSKALPQLNILTLSMASSLAIGCVVMLVTYPSLQSGISSLVTGYFDDLKQFMVVYGGK